MSYPASASECRQHLSRSVERAWEAFDRASSQPSRVTPSVPILFFGDLDAYWTSPLRVVTVGLNPSRREFPDGDPFRALPVGWWQWRPRAGTLPSTRCRPISLLSPYSNWFNAFEQLLNGAGSSYYAERAGSTALHTDILLPSSYRSHMEQT